MGSFDAPPRHQRATAPPVDEWTALADATGASPFAHPGWVEAWAAERSVDLEVVRIHRGAALAAVVPLVATGPDLATPTDWHTPIFEAVSTDEAALEELAGLVVAGRPRRLSLGFLDRSGMTHRAFGSRLRAAGYRTAESVVLRSPYLVLDGDWASYLASWPSKRRSDLGRRRRRLEELGRASFEVHDGSSDLEALLTEGFDVEASGWKGEGGTSILHEGTEGLYRRAARWAAASGRLRLGFLRLDGRPIAFDYSFQTARTHYLVKTGFRPDYAPFAPGKLLRAFMIERAFADGLDVYDFVGADDDWKREWTETTRTVVSVEAYRPGLWGGAARAADSAAALAHRARRRLRRFPRRGRPEPVRADTEP